LGEPTRCFNEGIKGDTACSTRLLASHHTTWSARSTGHKVCDSKRKLWLAGFQHSEWKSAKRLTARKAVMAHWLAHLLHFLRDGSSNFRHSKDFRCLPDSTQKKKLIQASAP
jgi:hypothetical protein